MKIQQFRFSAPLGSNMHQNCIFMKKCSPLEQEAHFCKSVRNHVQQKSNFSGWMCLRMPSCRIWAAKQISKILRKNVYYLHMSPPWGSLKFFEASNLFDFYSFLFFASTFSLIFQLNPIVVLRFSEIMLPARVGSTILEIGTHQLGP